MAAPTNTQFAVAVHVLTLLAAADGSQRSSEALASSVAVSPVHIRRVLGPLRRAGMVRSRAGVNGGWVITADPSTTTLADVWSAVKGDEQVLGLHVPSPDCEAGQRIQLALTEIDRGAARALIAELGETTLAELAADTAALVT